MADAHRIRIMRNIYRKLDGMALSFGMPTYHEDLSTGELERYVGLSLDDTMRELRLNSLDDIGDASIAEYHIENRSVYHKLRLLRNSASVFFKFSTSVDGKTVDKSMIPKMINEIIKEYDDEWKKWMAGGGLTGSTSGGIWERSPSEGTSWHREMNE